MSQSTNPESDSSQPGRFQVHRVSLGTENSSSSVSSYATPSPTMPADHAHYSTQADPSVLVNTSRKLMAQKTVRAKRTIYFRSFILFFVIITSLGLSWVLGRYDYHIALQILLVVSTVTIWWMQERKLAEAIEKHVTLKAKRHKTIQPSETAEWLNFIVKKWWMVSSESIVDLIREHTGTLLQNLAPPGVESIQLVECDLANQTPCISNVHVHEAKMPSPVSSTSCDPLNQLLSGGVPSSPIVLDIDVAIVAPDSKIVLRARLGGERFGYSTRVYVEGLNIAGSIRALVVFDREAPFPHISRLTATFTHRPHIWFSVRVLKGFKVMDVPFLKNWVHSFIMDIFTTLLVDPGKLSVDFTGSSPLDQAGSAPRAGGVLTITLQGSPPDSRSPHQGDPRRVCVLRIGTQKHHVPVTKGKWQTTLSFLVNNTSEDVLLVSMKLKGVVRSSLLATHSLPLSQLQLVSDTQEESPAERVRVVYSAEATIKLHLMYSPLPSFSLKTLNGFDGSSVSGVLYVHVHRASDLMSADSDGLSDPYCVVIANKKKLFTTHYILDTLNPSWERGGELLVADFTQVVLTFALYDWDGPLIGDDILGVAKLRLHQVQPEVLGKKLELSLNGETKRGGVSLGHVIVSVVFRPVSSVALSECPAVPVATETPSDAVLLQYDQQANVSAARAHVKKVAKLFKTKLLTPSALTPSHPHRSPPSSGHTVELTLVGGRNLVPKDANGFSDPYILVKYGQDVVFQSHVIKKTLNPEWNETAMLRGAVTDDFIKVECWDKDLLSTDDFMGSLQFTETDLTIFQDGPRWCTLNHVRTGEILLALKATTPSLDDWSHLDEASRPLMQVPMRDDRGVRGSIHRKEQSSSSDSSVFEAPPTAERDSDSGSTSALLPSTTSGSTQSFPALDQTTVLQESDGSQQSHPVLRRRHTLTYQSRGSNSPIVMATHGYDDSSTPLGKSPQPRYPETKADIARALKGTTDKETAGGKRGTLERTRSKVRTVYYNISGQVIEADGLKGELDNLELYIKLRLNTRPSYQRQQKFGRGPVVHKTRVLRGSRNPQWKEDFMVKESIVPSDSLLTVDLKSGSKIKIGTHVVTLDRFFEGSLKATKWLLLGNDMKLRIRLSRQSNPETSPLTPQRSKR